MIREFFQRCLLVLAAMVMVGCGIAPAPDVTQISPPTEAAASPSVEVTPSVVSSPTALPTVTALPSPTPISVSAVSEVAYRLPLVIQHKTETSASFFFELETPSVGVLLITPIEPAGFQLTVPFNAETARLQLTVEGLMPGTQYEAEVGLGTEPTSLSEPLYAGQVWGPLQFETPSDEEPLRIAVIGDSGFGEEVTFDLAAAMAAQNPDFTIHTGDLVYNIEEDPSHYEAFQRKWYSPLQALLTQMPVYPVVGNHDVEPAARLDDVPFYYTAFPSFTESSFEGRNQWYAFAYGDLQFVMLDSQTFFGETGRAEQNAFLAERLADTRFAHSIVAFHVPPFTSGSVHPDDGIAILEQWSPMFETANVPLVITGHSHNYERVEYGSVTYVISGGGSSALYGEGERLPESQVFVARSHYVIIDFYTDRFEISAHALNGDVLDQVTIPLE